MKLVTFIFAVLFLISCATEKAGIQYNDRLVTITGISDTQWTYFSLSLGKTVGNSKLNSKTEDAAWYQRSDWDFAICGKYIRTNSGTSGIGTGGIQEVKGIAYDNINTTPGNEYIVDIIRQENISIK